MQIVVAYIATAVVFLGLDVIALRVLIRPVFERHIPDLLMDGYRAGPALVFYLAYIGGVLFFVSVPALRADAPVQALWQGALIGAMAYGTYEFTNYATLKAWHPSMVAVDLAWGTVLTGVSAWAGVVAARSLGA